MFLTIIKNANLALAFFLELGVLVALGYWGFQTGQGTIARIGLGTGLKNSYRGHATPKERSPVWRSQTESVFLPCVCT
jgi:hypothetical protein